MQPLKGCHDMNMGRLKRPHDRASRFAAAGNE